MSLPLLSFKFNTPLISAKLVRRPCLLRMLDVNLEKNASLTLVCEPACYGKTTVVSELLQAPQELRPAGLGSERVGTTMKGQSSRLRPEEFGELRKAYWGRYLRARGYFVASTGKVVDEVIKEYIEM